MGVVLNKVWRDVRGDVPQARGAKLVLLVVLNHLFFMIAWSIFRPASTRQMFDLWSQMFEAGEWWPINVGPVAWAILIGMPLVHATPVRWVDDLRSWLSRLPWPVQALLVVGVGALVVGVGARQPSPFIYFQF
jgi:hypothetical protein